MNKAFACGTYCFTVTVLDHVDFVAKLWRWNWADLFSFTVAMGRPRHMFMYDPQSYSVGRQPTEGGCISHQWSTVWDWDEVCVTQYETGMKFVWHSMRLGWSLCDTVWDWDEVCVTQYEIGMKFVWQYEDRMKFVWHSMRLGWSLCDSMRIGWRLCDTVWDWDEVCVTVWG